MDTNIQKYQLKGEVYFWTYPNSQRNYPGWNMTVNKEGCDSLITLLKLMKISPYPSSKRIFISNPSPTILKVVNINAVVKPISTVTLHFNKDSEGWKFDETQDDLKILFNNYYLEKLEKGIQEIKKGNGDFAISDDNQTYILYLWWHLVK